MSVKIHEDGRTIRTHQDRQDGDLFWCNWCQLWLAKEMFHKSSGMKFGLSSKCKDCTAAEGEGIDVETLRRRRGTSCTSDEMLVSMVRGRMRQLRSARREHMKKVAEIDGIMSQFFGAVKDEA